jgi:hypothetical protein
MSAVLRRRKRAGLDERVAFDLRVAGQERLSLTEAIALGLLHLAGIVLTLVVDALPGMQRLQSADAQRGESGTA